MENHETEETAIFRPEEGESGKIEGVVTADRLDAIVLYDAIPVSARTPDMPNGIVALSTAVGVSPARIRQFRKTARYRKALDDALQRVAQQMLPEVLYAQYLKAVETRDTSAARFIGDKAAGPEAVRQGSNFNTYIQNTQNINLSNDELIREDSEILNQVKELAKRGDLLRRLGIPVLPEAVPAGGTGETETGSLRASRRQTSTGETR